MNPFIPLQLVILLFSIVVHEVAHGKVALWRGDSTARDRGRLTLNPIPHIDIFGTIIVPILLVLVKSSFLFGWAKPVPINPWKFKDVKKDMAIVGAAGPASNILLAVIVGIFYRIFSAILGGNHILPLVLNYAVTINLVLAVFNMIPIPPLDGSRIVMGFLPDDLAVQYTKIERFGFIIIFGLMYIGVFGYILWPIVMLLRFLIIGQL